MTTDKRYQASQASILPVENGFIVHAHSFDTALTFVAKNMDEVFSILRDTDIRVLVRDGREHIARLPGGPERLMQAERAMREVQRDPYADAPGAANEATGTSGAGSWRG